MKGAATPVSGVLLLLCLHCFLVSCEVKYDYTNGGPKGPAQWGNLNPPNWVQCKNGTNQSPIDITADSVRPQPHHPLALVYATSVVDAEIYNNGHTPTVEVHRNSGNLTISGVTYHLEEFHFHMPSEHKISFASFSMEMHLVHKSTSGKVAVVALLYKVGLANTFLSQFFGNLPSFTTPNVKTPIVIELPVIGLHPYFRYNGSLTTPPCSEIVNWTIIDHFPTLSIHQLQQLRAALPEENARPIQPKNGRKVDLFP